MLVVSGNMFVETTQGLGRANEKLSFIQNLYRVVMHIAEHVTQTQLTQVTHARTKEPGRKKKNTNSNDYGFCQSSLLLVSLSADLLIFSVRRIILI